MSMMHSSIHGLREDINICTVNLIAPIAKTAWSINNGSGPICTAAGSTFYTAGLHRITDNCVRTDAFPSRLGITLLNLYLGCFLWIFSFTILYIIFIKYVVKFDCFLIFYILQCHLIGKKQQNSGIKP